MEIIYNYILSKLNLNFYQNYSKLNKELIREIFGQFILKFITGGTSYFLFVFFLNHGISVELDTWLLLQPKLALLVTLSLFGFDSIYSINYFKNRNFSEDTILFLIPSIHLIFFTIIFNFFSRDLKLLERTLVFVLTFSSLINQIVINFIRVRIKIWKVVFPNLLAAIIIIFTVTKINAPINLVQIISLLILQNIIVLSCLIFGYKSSKLIYFFCNFINLHNYKKNIYKYYQSGFLIVSLSAISNLTFYADRYIFKSELQSVIKSNAVILNFLQICGIIVYAFFQGFSPYWTNYFHKITFSNMRLKAFEKYIYIIFIVAILMGVVIFSITYFFTPTLFPNISFSKYEIAIYVIGYMISLLNGSLQFFYNFYFKNHLFLFFTFLNLLMYYIIMFIQIKLDFNQYLVQRSLFFSGFITLLLLILETKNMILNEKK